MISIPAWFAWALLVGNFVSIVILLCKVFTTNYASKGVSRFPDIGGLVIGSFVLVAWVYFVILR